MTASLFHDASRAGVFHLPTQRRNAIEKAAGAVRMKLSRVVISHSTDSEGVLRQLGLALAFPDWYGANLDALHDCLTDPDWQPASGQILLIEGLQDLRSADPEGFSALVEVFQSAAEIDRDAGRPLWVLLDTPAADLPLLPDQ
ncbi:MAG: hypothetical protein H6R10_2503 [Rhodocyclaceae bacterium]|nr:hypothetical protein [Rhodocyclaceae bacterium]